MFLARTMTGQTPTGEEFPGAWADFPPRVARPAVVAITDDEAWASRSAEIVQDLGGVAEVGAWPDASRLSSPRDALLLHVDAMHCPHDVLSTWAKWAWQPICLVSLDPSPGAWDCENCLREIGYRQFLQPTRPDTYWAEVSSALTRIIASAARLVPLLATTLGASHRRLIDILTSAAYMIPGETTVASWARRVGVSAPQRLNEQFLELQLPSPKLVLDILRLLQVLEYASRSTRRLTRNDLARLFNYSSGDHLGKRARQLAGHTFGELRRMELSEIVLRCLVPRSK